MLNQPFSTFSRSQFTDHFYFSVSPVDIPQNTPSPPRLFPTRPHKQGSSVDKKYGISPLQTPPQGSLEIQISETNSIDDLYIARIV
jgi:hypothetical protein